MSSRGGLDRFLPDLATTVARFPVSLLLALVFALIGNLDVGNVIDIHSDVQVRLYSGLATAFWLATGITLFGEVHGRPASWRHCVAAAVALMAFALWWFNSLIMLHPMFVLPGAVLLFLVAAHMGRAGKADAFWYFGARFGLAVVLSGLAVLAFCGGLSAIVGSLEYLFGLKPPYKTYQHIWVTGLMFVAPVYGLSLLPDDLDVTYDDQAAKGAVRRGVSVLINYVLAPVILIYVAILHAYAAKIALDGTLPKGQVGTMVLLFGLGGSAAVLIAWPWRETGTRLVRWLSRYWFLMTIVPALLLVLGVWRRIGDYGVTPERYGLAVIAVWLVGLTVWFALRKFRFDPRIIVGALALLLLVGGTGPWGAAGLSISSQVNRLAGVFDKLGYLEEGRLKADLPAIGVEKVALGRQARSIIRFLNRNDAQAALKPFFAGRADDPFKGAGTPAQVSRRIEKQLNLHYANLNRGRRSSFHFNAISAISSPVSGDKLIIGPLDTSYKTPDATVSVDGQTLKIAWKSRQWTHDIKLLAGKLEKAARQPGRLPIVVEIAEPEPATLYVTSASGSSSESDIRLNRIGFWLIVDKPAGG